MPQHEKGQKLSDFISKFVSGKSEAKHPAKQRIALGYAEARDQAKKEKRS